jgi:hypothetical protein
MSEPWMPFFEDYKLARPGARHNGWNPERVFEAGFLAGMLKGAALPLPDADDEGRERWSPGWHSPLADVIDRLADALEVVNRSEIPNSSTEAVTIRTEWGVRFLDSKGVEEPVWLAEDEHEARAEAMGHDGKMMTRTVGPWEVVE